MPSSPTCLSAAESCSAEPVSQSFLIHLAQRMGCPATPLCTAMFELPGDSTPFLDATAPHRYTDSAPAIFRKMLAKEQQRIRAEYEKRFKELEKEREGPSADKLQRYTQLLVKQREIMLALTARLKRRDDQILNLQQELEAFEEHQKSALLSKTSCAMHLNWDLLAC